MATAAGARWLAEKATGEAEIVDAGEIERLLPPGAVHQGIALETKPLPQHSLDWLRATLERSDNTIVAVLDQVSDPRNVGAVMRSAAAFGAAALITQERHAPPETGALAKAASGALELIPLLRVTNLARTLDSMRDAGCWCIALDADADRPLGEADPGGNVALVLGSEHTGLRRLTRERCDVVARLPLSGPMLSLNVSAAAAVALYEATSQRSR